MPPPPDLLAAVTALLVEEGFEGISVRKVADRAGVSIGAVQHHFPTKAAMLTAAMDAASQQFRDRLEQRTGPGTSAEQALRAVVDELLGMGPERRPASVLWVARLARSAIDPSLAAAHAAEWQQVEDLLAWLIQQCLPHRDPEWVRDEAATLLAVADGLATAALVEPQRMPPARASALVDAVLERLLAS